jgi:D-alanine-D-alanine ligase
MQVAIVYSLPSKRMLKTEYSETDEDSSTIAKTVARGLAARGIQASLYPISEDEIEAIAKIKADCLFNLIEWCGRDIELAKKAFNKMRKLNTPVTGSDEKMYVLTGDKIETKKLLRKFGVPTPQSGEFERGDEAISPTLQYPVIVKPAIEHCSTGLTYDSIAYDTKQLKEIVKRQIKTFEQRVLAEEFIEGRELLVYLLQEKDQVRVLPIEEMIFGDHHALHFQTYQTKWDEKSEDYQSCGVQLAKLSKEEKEKIETICINTFKQLGLRGYARFDIRYRDGVPYILETNANPSVYDASDELDEVESEVIWGIRFPDYVKAIVEAAKWSYERGEKI